MLKPNIRLKFTCPNNNQLQVINVNPIIPASLDTSCREATIVVISESTIGSGLLSICNSTFTYCFLQKEKDTYILVSLLEIKNNWVLYDI